jgi:hypothetical protein
MALVSRLEIHLYYLSFLTAINQLTRLKEVRISGSLASTPQTTVMSVRGLLRLPTVERVELYCTFPSPAAFLQIWDGCSESIRHLALGNRSIRVNDSDYDWASSPMSDNRPKLKLQSFRLLLGDFILPWVTADACPFAFSQLTMLCVGQAKDIH